MANYCFYDGTIAGTPKKPSGAYATPGDTSTVIIRRGWVDSTKQTLNAADVARAFPLYAGECIVAAWYRVLTAEDTSNAKLDLGVDGGYEFIADGAVTPANTVVGGPAASAMHHVASNGNMTLVPNNSVAVDAGIFEVAALITTSYGVTGYGVIN